MMKLVRMAEKFHFTEDEIPFSRWTDGKTICKYEGKLWRVAHRVPRENICKHCIKIVDALIERDVRNGVQGSPQKDQSPNIISILVGDTKVGEMVGKPERGLGFKSKQRYPSSHIAEQPTNEKVGEVVSVVTGHMPKSTDIHVLRDAAEAEARYLGENPLH